MAGKHHNSLKCDCFTRELNGNTTGVCVHGCVCVGRGREIDVLTLKGA